MNLEEQVKLASDIPFTDYEELLDFKTGRPFEIRDIRMLANDPVRFYRSRIFLANYNWICAMMICYAASSTLIDLPVDTPDFTNLFFAFLLVVFQGAGFWLIGGWWFNVRIKWCVRDTVEALTGRIILGYNKLLYTIPVLLISLTYAICATLFNLSFVTRFWILTLLILVSFAMELWTCYNNIRTLKGLFEVKEVPLFFWFFGLPLMIQGIGIVYFVSVILKWF